MSGRYGGVGLVISGGKQRTEQQQQQPQSKGGESGEFEKADLPQFVPLLSCPHILFFCVFFGSQVGQRPETLEEIE